VNTSQAAGRPVEPEFSKSMRLWTQEEEHMSLKLMAVDDSRTIRRIVTTYARDLDPEVEIFEAADGQECLDRCNEYIPDIIILDVNMPVMTGEECLQHLRTNDHTKDIAVVMLTTESEKQLVVRLLQLGVQQFIIKPFEKQEFIEKVGGVLSKIETQESGGPKTASTPEGPYILVVEDKENIVRTIQTAAQATHEVVVTPDAGQAMGHFKKRAPALVLANLAMEGTDAFDLFAQMRKVPERQEARFVGMCLKTANEVITRARGTGYIQILVKPFGPVEVTEVISAKSANSVETETQGDVFIVKCEGNSFASMISMILKAVDGAAEEGFMKLCFDLRSIPEASLSDVTIWGGIAEKTESLGMSATYTVPSLEIVDKLKGLVDTQSLEVMTDQDEALGKLAA